MMILDSMKLPHTIVLWGVLALVPWVNMLGGLSKWFSSVRVHFLETIILMNPHCTLQKMFVMDDVTLSYITFVLAVIPIVAYSIVIGAFITSILYR
jgi:hypothetical protein